MAKRTEADDERNSDEEDDGISKVTKKTRLLMVAVEGEGRNAVLPSAWFLSFVDYPHISVTIAATPPSDPPQSPCWH